MNVITVLVEGGRFRRSLANSARERGWGVQEIFPADFDLHFRDIAPDVNGLDVEYEYVRSKLRQIRQTCLKDTFLLLVGETDEDSKVKLEEDIGAFRTSEFGNKSSNEVLDTLTSQKIQTEVVV